MNNYLRQLGKDSIVYGLGGFFTKSIGFFLLPVYTRLFSPSAYGTIEMLTVLNSLLSAVLIMGMDSAQSYYFFEQKKHGTRAQTKVITSILQWRITWGTAIVLLATLISPILNRLFFRGQLSWEYFVIAFGGALFTQVMTQSADVYRLLYRPWDYISVSLGQSVCSAVIAITLIIALEQGVIGYFIGMLAGSVLAALIGWWRLRTYLDWSKWHTEWWPRVLKLGVPLLPAGIAMYLLNTADRWFVGYYHGQDSLGLYAVGAKFAMCIAVAVTTFRKAWWPLAMEALQNDEGAHVFKNLARLYLGVAASGVVLLTALSPILLKIFTTREYYTAYPIIGILAWHSVFHGSFLIVAAGIWKTKKTFWITILMTIAALCNIGLDALMVPTLGGIGAAIATSTSFLLWNIMTLITSEKFWPVGYPLKILASQIVIGFGATIIILTLHASGENFWHVVIVTITSIIILNCVTFKSVLKQFKIKMVRNSKETAV